MKTLLLAATSTLALSGFAMAQTAATTEAPATDPAKPAAEAPAAPATEMPATTPATDAPAAGMPATSTDPAAPGTAAAPAAEPAAPVVAPDVKAPALSEATPGMLGSWMTSRHIWTTNQPSSTAWENTTLTERPADWQDIAKVDDLVLDDKGELVGYIADIGGFLGIGAKKVLLGRDAIHLVKVGDDSFFATNFTKDELKALPDFDAKTVVK